MQEERALARTPRPTRKRTFLLCLILVCTALLLSSFFPPVEAEEKKERERDSATYKSWVVWDEGNCDNTIRPGESPRRLRQTPPQHRSVSDSRDASLSLHITSKKREKKSTQMKKKEDYSGKKRKSKGNKRRGE